MNYLNIEAGSFLSRPNRFIAKVLVAGEEKTVHVKNTGRCRELLTPGAKVYLERAVNPARKTGYDLVAVEKEGRMVNMDSQAPNQAVEEFLREGKRFSGITLLKREVTYGNSRFDLYMEQGERKSFLEVKGVTLEENNIAMFPDAPTERGVKHIEELMAAKADGYGAYLLFVIQMEGISYFIPNDRTHPAFGEALKAAKAAGVTLLAYDCAVTPDTLNIRREVPIIL